MAHLLGSQACLESLTRDVVDIQSTAMDLLSRTGSARFPSWKYPDKVASELDMADLLECYSYSDDEDHCKLSHIILFELVIDRLVLLLRTLSQLSDQMLKSSGSEERPASSRFVGSAMSVGLVAKKFSSKVVQLQQAMQQLQLENKAKKNIQSNMESTIQDLRDELKMCKAVLDKRNGKKSHLKGHIQGHGANRSSAKFFISPNEVLSLRSPTPTEDITLSVEDVAFAKTFQETSSQTYDTAFVPCEACSRTQENLIDVGTLVMKVCESQGLPSSLAKQKKLLRKSIMAAADVSRWTSEQNQDLARINSHLNNLYAQINPLEQKLSQSQEMCRALERQVADFEGRRLHEKSLALQYEESLKEEFSKIVEEKDVIISSTNKTNEDLTRSKDTIQQMFSELKVKAGQYQDMNERLERENAQLVTDLESESQEVSRLKNADSDLEQLKVELDNMQVQLREASRELGKTQAKNRSLEKHEKALQSKHDALLHRVDEFDEECEKLRQKIMEMEDDSDGLQEALDKANEAKQLLEQTLQMEEKRLEDVEAEKAQLRGRVAELEGRTDELEQQLRDSEEKLLLLTDFPPLDGKPRAAAAPHDALSGLDGEADVMRDMERQIMANNIRIVSLEGQNDKLRRSITLLMAAQQDASREKVQTPVALWKCQGQSRTRSAKSDDALAIKPQSTAQSDEDWARVQPRPPQKPRAESAKTRARSASSKLSEKRQSMALSAKLASSGRQMLTSQADETSGVHPSPHAGWVASPVGRGFDATSPEYSPVKMFLCSSCDKMYCTKKDLDIHKSFCYGRI